MFPPKSWVFPGYHKSMTSPLRLTVFSRHRSVSTTLPSRIRYGTPSARTRSSASCKPGARAATTSITSSRYRYAVDCGSPKPAPSRGMCPPCPGTRPARTAPAYSSPACGSPPGADLAPPRGQQPGNEQDQVPGHVEHDTIGDHAEPLPVAVIFGETSSTGAPRLPGDLRVPASMPATSRLPDSSLLRNLIGRSYGPGFAAFHSARRSFMNLS
jgi:hypothetical protein